MFSRTDDVRIENLRPLIPPAILMEELAISEAGQERVAVARRAASDIDTPRNNNFSNASRFAYCGFGPGLAMGNS